MKSPAGPPPRPLSVLPPTSGTVAASVAQHTISSAGPSIQDRVKKVIDAIRPAVQGDGGDVELVEITPAGQVKVRFHGACVGCPSSAMTLKMGIERNLKQYVPEVTEVVAANP